MKKNSKNVKFLYPFELEKTNTKIALELVKFFSFFFKVTIA